MSLQSLGELDLSDSNNIAQQSKHVYIREGYPLSSKQVNDIFDSLFYDLLTILTDEPPRLDNITKQVKSHYFQQLSNEFLL